MGKLRSKLEELGIADNTMVVFMTDNGSGGGCSCGPDGHVEEAPCNFNAGMRGLKGWEYEGGHRVPFFLHCPSRNASDGRDVSVLTSYTDFMPTILDLCGVEVPKERTFHGRSLKPLIDGEPRYEWAERILVADTQRIARPVMWRKSSVMKDKWRLINGKELYDMSVDPGQKQDVAGEHPGVVAELREGYVKWWEVVSEQYDRDIPFALGEDNETVVLTTHDIRNESMQCAWNQTQVRNGSVVTGYWEVDIRSAGTYEFEFRRWPREAGHALTAGIDGDDVEQRRDCYEENAKNRYSGGEAVAIGWARLQIGDHTLHAELEPGATHVTFKIDLPEGPAHVYPSFHGSRPDTMAPYYIYVRKT
jgi:hypothetical protein